MIPETLNIMSSSLMIGGWIFALLFFIGLIGIIHHFIMELLD